MQLDTFTDDDVLYFQNTLLNEMTLSRGKIGEKFLLYYPKQIQNFIIIEQSSLTDPV